MKHSPSMNRASSLACVEGVISGGRGLTALQGSEHGGSEECGVFT